MAKYGMVIDLQKCVGCGACAIACKTENNTQNRSNGQTFNWADFSVEKKGSFPNMRYTNRPVLCNHCTDAACVEVCPVTPKAMYKTKDGITMHNDERCIGCRACQGACPYSALDVTDENAGYSVISFNGFKKETHPFFRDSSEVIKDGTASGAELAKRSGAHPPHQTKYQHTDYESVRRKGIVEKCTFCSHRVSQGESPYCVDSCPSSARIFGNLEDPKSEIAKTLKEKKPSVLKPEAGTKPNVYYINSFKAS